MKINLERSGIRIILTYDDNGYLDTVKNIDTDEYMMLEFKCTGSGVNIINENSVIGGSYNVCDAIYVRIMDMDIFVPKYIFIMNHQCKH